VRRRAAPPPTPGPGSPGFTVWITGLSGSGKHTLAALVEEALVRRGWRVEVLAGRDFRESVSRGLDFSRAGRAANVRRIGYVAKLLARNGVAVITASVSPERAVRDECRAMIGRFVEVHLDCPAGVCGARERSGLYDRAARDTLAVAGIDGAYEAPLAAEVTCRTADETPEVCRDRVLAALERLGYLERAPAAAREADRVKARLRSLGYG
jgi:adenylyl-sulfate kinase